MTVTTPDTAASTANPREIRVSEVPGFAFDVTQYLFEPEDRMGAFNLWTALKGVCGSSTAGVTSYRIRPEDNPSVWITLRDVPPGEVLGVVARMQRNFSPWRLPANGDGVVEQIDRYFDQARAAKIAATASQW